MILKIKVKMIIHVLVLLNMVKIKGNKCGCSKLYENSQLCKRHWNLKNKTTTI